MDQSKSTTRNESTHSTTEATRAYTGQSAADTDDTVRLTSCTATQESCETSDELYARGLDELYAAGFAVGRNRSRELGHKEKLSAQEIIEVARTSEEYLKQDMPSACLIEWMAAFNRGFVEGSQTGIHESWEDESAEARKALAEGDVEGFLRIRLRR